MKAIIAAAVLVAVSSIGSGVAAAATDCVVGPDGITYSPDLTAISVFFDAFEADATDSAACELSVPTGVATEPGTFNVYSADYRGFVAEGDVAELEVVQEGFVDGATIPGPQDAIEPYLRSFVGTGGDETIDSALLLTLVTASDPGSITDLDSIDYALAATTTIGAVEASLGELSEAHTAAVLHLQTLGNLLTGINRPLESSDEIVLLGGVGSHFVGVSGRRGFADGWSVQGGAAYFDQDAGGADARGVVLAGSLRYIVPGSGPMRPFAEGGLSASRMRLGFSRGYDAGPGGIVNVTGRTDGAYAGIYARGGVLFDLNPDNQVSVAATLSHGQLRTDAYDEGLSADNLFSARFGDETSRFQTAKIGAAWTGAITPSVDLTLNGAVGKMFGSGDLDADVSFVGDVSVEARDDSFVEYGARVGFKPTELISADVFVQGTTGSSSGTHAYFGGSLRRQF